MHTCLCCLRKICRIDDPERVRGSHIGVVSPGECAAFYCDIAEKKGGSIHRAS